ncbi:MULTISPECIES: hypothetical protein [Streptomyces]|uniref:Uncharacterized protein n=3 Tax=Streptomyces violaceusniger group TaxID=2839105 RepID=A0A4D4K5K4_9ACTN|nr:MULTISPECIES: hypothetical protein [Streptomyces]WJE00528.1 hypothetical protein QR300_33595 [Streptomyces antimycoticus]BBJ44913.1 hypothetical protein SSPO_076310 [Streptomyces antimycoticus]GDY41627.1 hypothetical protein SANT12839_025090 [Streptomyces antimycoticus]SEB63905.1 hypothetical protein SAMN04490356_1062 [Streptomyces melanosporofaciens]
MAGFRALAREVRNPRRHITARRTSLRKCLERFAPYGHRATWHHLCTRSGIPPEDRRPDPLRLLTALEELEEARTLWLAYEADFAARRRQEKLLGIRQPSTVDDWHLRTWGGCDIIPCESPSTHPGDRLADVLRRLIAAMESGPGSACPVCAQRGLVWREDLDRYPSAGPVCADCGIVVPLPLLTTEALAASRGTVRLGRYATV